MFFSGFEKKYSTSKCLKICVMFCTLKGKMSSKQKKIGQKSVTAYLKNIFDRLVSSPCIPCWAFSTIKFSYTTNFWDKFLNLFAFTHQGKSIFYISLDKNSFRPDSISMWLHFFKTCFQICINMVKHKYTITFLQLFEIGDDLFILRYVTFFVHKWVKHMSRHSLSCN